MTAPSSQRSQVGDSPRVSLARLALETALAVSGVVRADAGPHGMCATPDPSKGLLRGASVCALADGRYGVDLCLVAGIVPLLELAEEVRSKVQARVQREGLSAQLGEVNVEFVRVLSAEEISENEAPERETEHAPPPSLPEPKPASASGQIAPPSSNETTVAEALPGRGEPAAAEGGQQPEEALQEQALLAQERALLAQEWALLARERRLAREREDALVAETLPTSAAPSVSSSDPIAPPLAPADRERPS